MAHPVTWFTIYGPDADVLQSFYEGVFRWNTMPGPDGMKMIEAVGEGIAGGLQRAQDGKSSVTVFIETNDLDDHLDRVEGAGGTRAMEPMELPGGMGHIAGFVDPAGNWIGLWAPGKTRPVAPRAKNGAKKAAPKRAAAKKPAAKKAAPKRAAAKAPAKKAKAKRR